MLIEKFVSKDRLKLAHSMPKRDKVNNNKIKSNKNRFIFRH